jgi:ferredoxin
MKVRIDREKCTGEKRCFNVYPDLYVEDEEGKGQVISGINLSEEDEVDAQSSANACPNGAIIIEY